MESYESLLKAEVKAAAANPVRKAALAALADTQWQAGVSGFVRSHARQFAPGIERQPSWTELHQDFQEALEGALEDVLATAGVDPTSALQALCSPIAPLDGVTPLPVHAELPLRAFVDYDAFEQMMRHGL